MFELINYRDKFGREYVRATGNDDSVEPKKVVVLMPVYNMDDYLAYCIKSFANQKESAICVDNGSTDNSRNILVEDGIHVINYPLKGDLSAVINHGLDLVEPGTWVFYVNPDEILFDLPDKYLGRLAAFLEKSGIFCADVHFPDFCYNYGTLFAGFEWGDGPGYYWTARRFFKYTGKEKFVGKTHFNVSNCSGVPLTNHPGPNNEHTGQWIGTVAKLPNVHLFHYGKLRGIEKQRGKEGRLVDGELFALGMVPTIPYKGPHPSVMGLNK